jgi:hypothetical protein
MNTEDFLNSFWGQMEQSGVAPTEMTVTQTYSGGPRNINVTFRSFDDDSYRRFKAAIAGEAADWTSVDSATPDNDDEVLVSRDGEVAIAQFWGDADGWSIEPAPEFWRPKPQGPLTTTKKKRKRKKT